MPDTLIPSSSDTVVILLAVLDGGQFLQDQLDSIAGQSHTDWRLVLSDDGSTDNTAAIARDFATAHPGKVVLRDGPKSGFARHFMHLLSQAPAAPFVALCDQDDVWKPEKLQRAVDWLRQRSADEPVLYCARTMVTNRDLDPLRISDTFERPPNFRNALVQSVGGGNTMVLNAAAHQLAAWAAPQCPDPVAHDWWLYQVITGCGGTVLRDPEPMVLYRQHGRNQIGARRTWWHAVIRLLEILGGRWRDWNPRSLAALAPLRDRMTDEAVQVLDDYAAARSGPVWQRMNMLRRSGVHRQGRGGTIALFVMCGLGRL